MEWKVREKEKVLASLESIENLLLMILQHLRENDR